MSLGERLRRARRRRGLTQTQLADLVDTSQSVIQKIENHKSLRPRCIERIAEALSVSASWLAYGEGKGTCQVVGCFKSGRAVKWDDANHIIEVEVYLCSEHESFTVL